jgi:hypothetical protein
MVSETGTTESAAAPPSMVVYLCTGRTVVIPSVSVVTVRDDKVVCRDAGGVELASFAIAEVSMCSRKLLPAAPL